MITNRQPEYFPYFASKIIYYITFDTSKESQRLLLISLKIQIDLTTTLLRKQRPQARMAQLVALRSGEAEI